MTAVFLAARHYTSLFSAQCCQIRKISRSAQVVRPVCRSAGWGGKQGAGCNLPGGKIRNVICGACKFSLDVQDFDRFLLPINIVSNFRDWFRRIRMRSRGCLFGYPDFLLLRRLLSAQESKILLIREVNGFCDFKI